MLLSEKKKSKQASQPHSRKVDLGPGSSCTFAFEAAHETCCQMSCDGKERLGSYVTGTNQYLLTATMPVAHMTSAVFEIGLSMVSLNGHVDAL